MAMLTKQLNEEVYVDIYKKILLKSVFIKDLLSE